jgi:hypothetical protein
VGKNGRDAPDAGINEVLIGRRDTNNSLQWWIGLQGVSGGTGEVTFLLRDTDGGTDINQDVVGVNLTDDTDWHHVVLVRDTSTDPDTNTLYVDGVSQGSVAQNFDAGFDSPDAKLSIGYLNNANYFDGLIDEVAIYGRALDLTEIGEHYDNGFLDKNSVTALRPEPAADAGTDQSVTEGDTVELDGSGSSDADGTIVSYQWQQLTGPTVTPLANAATDTASFTAPTVDAAGAILTFRLTVTDNEGQSSSNDTSVQVNDTTTTTPTPPHDRWWWRRRRLFYLHPVLNGNDMAIRRPSIHKTWYRAGQPALCFSKALGCLPANTRVDQQGWALISFP